ncbi:MAG: endolytic transglycosylase MltG [Deltaproteobacteria bacterium]|nr:endolytic transglycosylase MltG [Deltaproteobacteria bacterium]
MAPAPRSTAYPARHAARGWLARRAAVGLLLCAVLTGGGLGGWVYVCVNRPPDAGDTETAEFTVPAGATLRDVGRRLEKAGFIRSARVWRAWLWLHPPVPIKAGKHPLSRSMPMMAVAEALAGKPLAEDAPLTVVEGWRICDVDAFLAQGGLAAAGAYSAATREAMKYRPTFPAPPGDLEGYLLPETYRVPVGPVDVEKLVARQLDAFTGRFFKPYAEEIARSGRSLHALVTVASMLEREEHDPTRRPAIAGVIYRRLEAGVALGIDATSRYHLRQWNDRENFLVALRDPADPYNTRLRTGLPPGPIGAPSVASLVAALRPEKSAYWYYLHDARGGLHFARTADEHEANRRRYNVY